ncbi:MAG: carbonic anhydrase [Candidatus Hydrogenedens sp.]|nr:carbonic anhydrase [Candidatus Hydrogenedens sp.]
MPDIDRFIQGFRAFQEDYFGQDTSRFDALQQGQSPKTMVIGCSDSRVDPAILTNCGPGDLFTVRNVANLVPPFESDSGRHGVSAALEFAVCYLEIEHIVVLGHSQCGGIKALMEGINVAGGTGFIERWMSIAAPVRDRVVQEFNGRELAFLQCAAEQAAILLSLENLHSFPFVEERMTAGKLALHGWYFNIAEGCLSEYDNAERRFEPLGA